jgi:hypothetical protein
MDVGLGDEGELYGGTFGVLRSDANRAVSPADIGFDYSEFDFIDFGTSMPQTTKKPKAVTEEEGPNYYDDSYRTRQVLAQMESILGRKQSFEQ